MQAVARGLATGNHDTRTGNGVQAAELAKALVKYAAQNAETAEALRRLVAGS